MFHQFDPRTIVTRSEASAPRISDSDRCKARPLRRQSDCPRVDRPPTCARGKITPNETTHRHAFSQMPSSIRVVPRDCSQRYSHCCPPESIVHNRYPDSDSSPNSTASPRPHINQRQSLFQEPPDSSPSAHKPSYIPISKPPQPTLNPPPSTSPLSPAAPPLRLSQSPD